MYNISYMFLYLHLIFSFPVLTLACHNKGRISFLCFWNYYFYLMGSTHAWTKEKGKNISTTYHDKLNITLSYFWNIDALLFWADYFLLKTSKAAEQQQKNEIWITSYSEFVLTIQHAGISLYKSVLMMGTQLCSLSGSVVSCAPTA